MNIKLHTLITFFLTSIIINAQTQNADSSKTVNLNEVTIAVEKSISEISRMPLLKDNVIYAGKKTEVIQLDKINADVSTNNARQVFSKVPGVSVWESDGSGIQTGIATRGLSPNRSWEFNVRQNGYDISSDIFGYPEAYYSPPMEALGQIEVIRGAASLQYGPQFGGVINYQIKKANPNKPISFETQQTIGSYNLFNTYNAIGGTYKKVSYYAFLHNRSSDGWRDNSRYNIYTAFASVAYQLTSKINIAAEYTNMNYNSQQPGGLTDKLFNENHRQSLRERNWMGTPWNVASLTFKYDVSPKINLQVKSFLTVSERNSVGYMQGITFKDSVNPATLQYNPRQVDRDFYNNYGAEARLSIKYNLFGKENVLAGGVRFYNGTTKRKQLGAGTTGSDFDLTIANQLFGRSLQFSILNYAAFAENIFNVGERLKIVPGLRMEYIENTASGYINTTSTGVLKDDKRTRQVLLYGLGAEFKVTNTTNLYANYSTAFRPVTYSELTPSATTDIIDPNLKDANGFNVDLGYRGTLKNIITFDIGAFYLNYDNRIGTVSQSGNAFRTNIGTSVSQGVESYIEVNPVAIFIDEPKCGSISLFASNSIIDAKYTNWNNPAIANDPTKSIKDKRVENAPQYIHRFGATYNCKSFSATFQMSSIGDVFTDAANTEKANAASTLGKLNGYQVMDIALSYKFMERYNIRCGVNNIVDEKYATRRAGGYPGPGILPANGRTFFVSIGANF